MGHILKAIFIACLLQAQVASAHSFWVEPSSYVSEKDAMLSFTLLVGKAFDGEEYVRSPSHLKRFEIHAVDAKDQVLPVAGRFGRSPAGYTKLSETKAYVVGYMSEFSEASLDAETFAKYVEEEGLTSLVPTVDKKSTKEIKELFARNTKALLLPKNHRDTPVDKTIGMTLELFCHEKSLTLPKEGPLSMKWQLLFEGKPLGDRLVTLEDKKDKKIVATMMSDKEGMVSFNVAEPGVYLVRSVNIRPAEKTGWDWRSQWTSTSFLVQGK